jgi:predicted amidohydrolase YtcJ
MTPRTLIRCALILLLAWPAPSEAAAPAGSADTILVNGEILLFDGVAQLRAGAPADTPSPPRFAEAMAITDGRIELVGSSAEVRRRAGPETRTIDLGGRMVMPGIVDGHFHGTGLTDCHMAYEGGTVAHVLARLQSCLDRADQKALEGTNTRFAAAYFFGDALEPAGAALGRSDLDRLRTTRPVLVRNADGHKFWMNSRAITNAGLDERTPDPPDGTIGRDATRKPNGFFADYDAGDWGARKPVTAEARLERVRRTMADAHRAGITAVFLPGGGQDEIGDWARLQDEGGLDLRVSVGLSAPFVLETRDPAEIAKRVEELAGYKKHAKGMIDVSSVKVMCDGVMEYPALTAAMLVPYRVNAGTALKPDWRPGSTRGPDPACAQGRPGFLALAAAGFQIHVHAIGDRATREALDNFEAARQANGDRDLRHTITHLEAIDAADVPRFGALGVIASLSLQWARRDGYTVTGTQGYIADGLYERLFPAAALVRAGALIAGGSDYPVDPLLPFVQIETALDRTGEAVPGVFPGALAPREAIADLLTVIRIHTINAAAQLHAERRLGSLEVGKEADLVVLGQNLFRVPTEQISDTRVLLTMVGGKVVFDAGDPALGPRPRNAH